MAAVNFAVQEKLWTHALVISSSINKQAFADAVKAFTRSELTGTSGAHLAKGREALRLTYEMFGGVNGSQSTLSLFTRDASKRCGFSHSCF